MEKPIYNGLSEIEVVKKLKEQGYNELPATIKQRNWLTIALEAIREPMILLLLIAGAIYLVLGDPKEAIVLLIFVAVIIVILVFQQRKTEHVLEALRDLTSPRALVIRDNIYKRIAGREVVVEDIVVLKEGDRIPADAILLTCHDLRVNESMLTGEAISVSKKKSDDNIPKNQQPGGDNLPYVYSGTMVTQGQGIAKVIATGTKTEIGKIGKVIQEIKPEKTPLQKMTGRLVKNLVILGLSLCTIIIIIYGFTRGSWLGGILAGITFAMATLPEEFPVILTVFFALGAWRISKLQVLTRQIPAIETLGATTVLCVDKTGTLTLNQMRVDELFIDKAYTVDFVNEPVLPSKYHDIVEFSILASEIEPFDAMEIAIHKLGEHYLKDTKHLHADRTLIHEYELTPDLLVITHVWKIPDQSDYIVATKGSPEAVYKLCHLDEETTKQQSNYANSMAKKGLRVLGVAKAIFTGDHWPKTPQGFKFEFLGLVGLSDPVRPSAKHAIDHCHRAGVRVVMITGDYPTTALAIAKQLGMQKHDEIITGNEIVKTTDDSLKEQVNKTNIFARILPRQKLKIIHILKSNDEIVAMTGDGVNDAPALKAAHIGIAMGQRGTDVAREASSIVLLNDDLSSIVEAIKLGRRIFNNIKKAMAYIFAVHIPIAGLTLIPLIVGWPLLFFPIHIAFLQLIIDPACSIAFEAEPEEKNIMNRPPRKLQRSIFSRRMIVLSIIQGIIVLIISLSIYGSALYINKTEDEARALAFTTLVIANLCLILTNRSWSGTIIENIQKPNSAMWWIIGGALVLISAALFIPFMRHLFHFDFLHLNDIILCLTAGIFSIVWFELIKIISKKFKLKLDE
ncbi:MAG: cation-translocating P-type ATPase [Gammaproteobacteria bacterium]|nr:cation-translocating P-type ATPase [Gammaproteobacteria bacterium]